MNNRWVTKNVGIFFDKDLGRSHFHAICTPPEFPNWSGIPTADEIHPECLIHIGYEFDHLYGEVAVADICSEVVDEGMHVLNDRGCFDQCVDTSHEDSFSLAYGRWQHLHGLEQEHGECCAVLSTTQADHPRDVARLSIESAQVDHE
jgi:hypothetical protein